MSRQQQKHLRPYHCVYDSNNSAPYTSPTELRAISIRFCTVRSFYVFSFVFFRHDERWRLPIIKCVGDVRSMHTTVDHRALTARSRPFLSDSLIRDLHTFHDEPRGRVKFDPVADLFKNLADDRVSVHIPFSLLCREVPEQSDCTRVEVKIIRQGGKPMIDVRHLLRTA